VSKITRTASAGMQSATLRDGDSGLISRRYGLMATQPPRARDTCRKKGRENGGCHFQVAPPPGGPLSRAGPAPCVLSAARSPRPVGRRSSGSSAPGSSRNRVAIDSLAATVASCSQLRDRLRHKMLWSGPMLRQRTRPKPLLSLDSECRRTAIMENGTFRERERESRCHGGEVAMQPFGVSASDHNPLGSPYSR
jgi:hypothetical protein